MPATVPHPGPVSTDVETKARAYLRDGRVHLELVIPEEVVAQVTGTRPEPYLVRWRPRGGWRCTCPATRRCAHLLAVAMVTKERG